MLWRHLLALPLVITIISSAAKVSAVPANIFRSQLEQIISNLPPGWEMRLPSEILLSEPADEGFINELIVRVFPSSTPPGLTIGLFTCDISPYPCLVGSFSVDSQTSANAQREFRKHQAANMQATLAPGIQGYLLEGQKQNPPNSFSSVIWKQDGMIYTVSFPAEERQNILLMASSMANQPPIRLMPTPRRVLPLLR